jgi:hypothetical protein
MRRIILTLLLLVPMWTMAQNRNAGGQFALGVRSTTSFFNHGGGLGTGFGGQFRLRFFNFMNSEWFADYFTSDLDGIGTRTDYHIGWSVMFYPTNQKFNMNTASFKAFKPVPYI